MTAPESPWWSDALTDPWRDPCSPATITMPPVSPVSGPPLEPVNDPSAKTPLPPRKLVPVVLVTALLASVLAGGLGGTLGYTYGARGNSDTLLGARNSQPGAALPAHGSLAEIVNQVLPSVVTVRSGTAAGSTVGSGFVVSGSGHVITNDHVVGETDDTSTITFHDGSNAEATLVGRDRESDVAVLKVDGAGVPPAELGDSETVQVGDPVLAVGSPLSLTNTVTSGIVSAVDRAIRAGEPGGAVRYYAAIQTDAAVNQGNSGGPLVDSAGRVVGINSVIRSVGALDGEAANIGLAFAIPIDHARRVAQEIIDIGQARRTVLGVKLDRSGNASGVRLTAVADHGPAAAAGMRKGDVLVKLDQRPLAEPTDLIALVRKHSPGSVVSIEYLRGSERAVADVTLAAG